MNPNPAYKLMMARARRAEFLVLGTSRVLQFRDFFLTERPEAFYNAGRGVRRISEFRDFLQALPSDYAPKVLVLGLDQYFFNANWDPVASDSSSFTSSLSQENTWVLKRYRKIFHDHMKGKFSIRDLLRRRDPISGHYRPAGIRACVRSHGFRPDGSLFNGTFMSAPNSSPDYPDFSNTLERIAAGNARFQPGDDVNPLALEELDALLTACVEKKIHVVGFLPPFAHKVFRAMQQSEQYRYLNQIPELVGPRFASLGFSFFDFSDNVSFGSHDLETIGEDAGFHGSEVAYLRLFIEMARSDAMLGAYTKVPQLEQLLSTRKSPLLLDAY